MGFQGESVSTELSLAICPAPVKQTSSFKSVSTDLSLAICPAPVKTSSSFESFSTDLSLAICPAPVKTSSSFESFSTDLSLAIYPVDLKSPILGFQEGSVSTDLSLAICPDPVMTSTSSFTKEFVVDDRSVVPFEKSPQQDSAKKTSKRSRFATLQEEEDYYSQEIQNLYPRMTKNCVGETTSKATNVCPLSSAKVITKKRKITKKMDRGEVVSNEATHELRRFIEEEMNGVDMKLVIQKNLYATDLNPTQNRLNMPINQLETHEFLKPDEREFLETHKKNEIEVRLVGPTLQMYTKPMKLKLWHMKRTRNYVLITNWNHFVVDNKDELKEGTKIQVWSFRQNQQLCFAIAIVGRPDDRNNAA